MCWFPMVRITKTRIFPIDDIPNRRGGVLGHRNGFFGADVNAGTAFAAGVHVDDSQVVLHLDGREGARVDASSTSRAFLFINRNRHSCTSSFSLDTKHAQGHTIGFAQKMLQFARNIIAFARSGLCLYWGGRLGNSWNLRRDMVDFP